MSRSSCLSLSVRITTHNNTTERLLDYSRAPETCAPCIARADAGRPRGPTGYRSRARANGMMNRRDVLGAGLAGAAAFGFGRIDPAFLFASAFAAERRAVRFLGAEALTGNWDPTTHTNLGQLIVEGFVFGYLTRAPMRPEKPDELVFELAESLTPIDAFAMEVKLRKGVTFHDGTPFTAADVKATYEYGCQPDRPAQWYPGLVTVDVVDDHTCRLDTRAAGYPAALYYYLSSFLPIMSAKDVADKARLSARMNGTGPFRYVEQTGDTTVLAANPTFFMGAPKIPGGRVSFRGRHPRPARFRF